MRLKGCESRDGTFRTGELVLLPDCSLASILLALDSGYGLMAPPSSSHPCLLPLFGPLDDKWLPQTSLHPWPGAWELLGLERPRENSFQQYLQASMCSLDFEPRCEAVSAFAKIGHVSYSQCLHRQLMLDNVQLSRISLGPVSVSQLLCLPPLCLAPGFATFFHCYRSPTSWSFASTGSSSLALLPSTPWHPYFRGIPYFQSLLQFPHPARNGLALEWHKNCRGSALPLTIFVMWANYSTVESFSFLICKMGMILLEFLGLNGLFHIKV